MSTCVLKKSIFFCIWCADELVSYLKRCIQKREQKAKGGECKSQLPLRVDSNQRWRKEQQYYYPYLVLPQTGHACEMLVSRHCSGNLGTGAHPKGAPRILLKSCHKRIFKTQSMPTHFEINQILIQLPNCFWLRSILCFPQGPGLVPPSIVLDSKPGTVLYQGHVEMMAKLRGRS